MIFKIVLLGDAMVGKTTIRLRYLGEGFREKYLSTFGSDFALKRVGNHQLQIWDLAGQPNFKPIIRKFYRGAHGLVLVFDVMREETMINIKSWIDDYLSTGNKTVPSIIIGNKIDLRSNEDFGVNTDVAKKLVEDLSKQYGQSMNYIETSALTGENIENAFEKLINDLVKLVLNPRK